MLIVERNNYDNQRTYFPGCLNPHDQIHEPDTESVSFLLEKP